MLNAILSRWAQTRTAATTLETTLAYSPAHADRAGHSLARSGADSLWQSLLRLIPGEPDAWAGHMSRPALRNNLPAARAEFEASLVGLHGENADELLRSIRRSRTMRDLWHLRTWLYTEVARAFSQQEAEQRLALLNSHFTAFAALGNGDGRRH